MDNNYIGATRKRIRPNGLVFEFYCLTRLHELNAKKPTFIRAGLAYENTNYIGVTK